ncbi:putative co-chaperone GrpE [Cryptosporidium canis]|uniref:Co-chaperone GrpE n=1 Tax=Cryptosporidium canis TaxID=195482 RepID=A0A9D5DK73_9CRYT|nr:putative co-chaperone GrpE [Cryptosporidium canis]
MLPYLATVRSLGVKSAIVGLGSCVSRGQVLLGGKIFLREIGRRAIASEPSRASACQNEERAAWEAELAKMSLLQERIRTLENDASGYIHKIEESKEKLLRSLAENENLRQRHKKELELAREYSISGFARSLLDVSDSLSRALSSVNVEKADKDSIASLHDGVSMTYSALDRVFEAHGIKRFQSLGKQFDPKEHEAVFEVKDSTKPKGLICEELQPGYKIHGRILRAAKVATIRN